MLHIWHPFFPNTEPIYSHKTRIFLLKYSTFSHTFVTHLALINYHLTHICYTFGIHWTSFYWCPFFPNAEPIYSHQNSEIFMKNSTFHTHWLPFGIHSTSFYWYPFFPNAEPIYSHQNSEIFMKNSTFHAHLTTHLAHIWLHIWHTFGTHWLPFDSHLLLIDFHLASIELRSIDAHSFQMRSLFIATKTRVFYI